MTPTAPAPVDTPPHRCRDLQPFAALLASATSLPPPPSPLRCCRPQHLRLGRRSLHRLRFAATRPPPSPVHQPRSASAACGLAPHTRQRNPCHSRARWRTPHMLISPVKGCRRWSEGASTRREGVGTAAADEKAAHVAQQPAWGDHWPWAATSCAGACARCSAEEASCDAALARAQRVELAEQPAQTALASRRRRALAEQDRGAISGRKIEARFGAQLRSGVTTRCIPVRV